MKKFFKVIISFVVIALIAVGAYFIFRTKDNSKAVYNNVYNLSYNITDGDINVADKLKDVVVNMIIIIDDNSLDIESVQKDLETFRDLEVAYTKLKNEILSNGAFLVKNSQIDQQIEASNSYFENIKDIYYRSYSYLKDTYFKIVNTDYNINTMKSYIQNFNNIFKEVLENYNNFYYNSLIAYSHGLDNMMRKNNLYKLEVEYASNLMYAFFTEKDNAYYTKANNVISYLRGDLSNRYFENKNVYDELMNNSLHLDILSICKNVVAGTIDSYITESSNAELVQKYVNMVEGR